MSTPNAAITAEEKSYIIKKSLLAIMNEMLSNKEDKEIIYLSTENISFTRTNGFPNPNIKMLSPRAIQNKANLYGDFKYFNVSEFRITGSCIAVSVNHTWAQGKKSKVLYLDGGGLRFEYYKENDLWKGKVFSSWIS